jgi:hypothetical protein
MLNARLASIGKHSETGPGLKKCGQERTEHLVQNCLEAKHGLTSD